MKKNGLMPRVICAALVLCLGVVMASPMVYATTPEQETVLATGQRSLNNPEGGFETPEAVSRFWLFHPDTWNAGRLIVENALQQIFFGSGDHDAIRRIFAYAPIIREGDELPPLEDFVSVAALPYMLQIGICDLYVALQETQDADVYRVVALYVTRAGAKYWVSSGILYDTATGILENEHGDGIMGIGYNYDASQEMLRVATHGWNRALGYSVFFDMAAPLALFFFDTLRFPFTYDGRDWMIQIWKGIYMVTNGAEIALYEKPAGRPVFWDASDTMLDISMQLYQGERLCFDYGTQHTWWTGGFSYASPVYQLLPYRQLRMTGTITFEDPDMLAAFLASFEENKSDNITGTVNGLTFSFDWQEG